MGVKSMNVPTFAQMQEFYKQVETGRITRANFQDFLKNPNQLLASGIFPVTYDQSLGLRELIERAVGASNLKNIDSSITQERFPLKGDDVRTVKCRVEPFLDGETGEEAAKRLTAAGYQLANTGDLAGFLHDHPEEVEKWSWVVALSEDSRWARPRGSVGVPYAYVNSTGRVFYLGRFRHRFGSVRGVLVLCE